MHLKHLPITLTALAGIAAAQSTIQSLNATIASIPDLSNLTAYLNVFPSLASFLNNVSNVTVVAPSNEAFNRVLNGTLGPKLAGDPGLIQIILSYHVLEGVYETSDIKSTGAFIETKLTESFLEHVTGGQRVEAILEGDDVMFASGLMQNSTVTQADIKFTGGILHVLDDALRIPRNTSATAIATNLTALAGALNTTGLISIVDGTPDTTVFAPANDAFQAVGSALDGATTEELTSMLAYHVVNGSVVYSTDWKDGMLLPTMNGESLTVRLKDGDAFVNGARIVRPDVLVANGVVHIIDNVLNPSNTTASPGPSATTGAPGFAGASSATAVPFTSGVPTPAGEFGSELTGTDLPPPTAEPTTTGSDSAAAAATGAVATGAMGAVGAAALFGAGAALLGY